jgi:hypothetical protein
MLRKSNDQTSIPTQVLSAGLDGTVSGNGASVVRFAQSDSTSWIPMGNVLYRYATASDHTLGTYNVKLYEDGWYDIYLGAYDYTDGTVSLGYKIYDGVELIVPSRTLIGASDATESNAASILVASVYLKAGEHTIEMEGTGGADYILGIKFEYTGATKTSEAIIITEGENGEVFAEVVTEDPNAVLFLAQYEGEGATRTMVANNYAAAKAMVPSAVGEKYYYKTQLKTAGNGEIKAFLWNEDSYAPLTAAATLN